MIRLRVNGVEKSFDGDPQMPLLWYLRDGLGLMGTKFGCGVGLCGACTVNQGGKAIRSCVTPMSTAAGSEVITIEGLGRSGLHPVQKAWIRLNVPQCGYCQSGQIMQAAALLKSNHNPTTRTSTRRWRETSAGAAPIKKFAPRSRQQRRKLLELNSE